MDKWDYRIVKHVDADMDYTWFGIHEVYFDKKNKPQYVTENGVCLVAESVQELKEDYKLMDGAFKFPVLDESDFDKSI